MSKRKRTPWFPANVKPVRNGWYETLTRELRHVERRYWNGVRWFWDSDGLYVCILQRHEWRGIQGDEHSCQIGANTYLVEFDEPPDRPGDDK